MKEKNVQSQETSTPEQLLDKYSYARDIGWTKEQIEQLYQHNLIQGNEDETTHELYILNESFVRIMEFHKKQQETED